MARHIFINKKISPYTRTIQVSSDKSLSIRTVLLASQAVGISKISNLLESEDVLNTLKTKPTSLYLEENKKNISLGNIDDHISKINKSEWII